MGTEHRRGWMHVQPKTAFRTFRHCCRFPQPCRPVSFIYACSINLEILIPNNHLSPIYLKQYIWFSWKHWLITVFRTCNWNVQSGYGIFPIEILACFSIEISYSICEKLQYTVTCLLFSICLHKQDITESLLFLGVSSKSGIVRLARFLDLMYMFANPSQMKQP